MLFRKLLLACTTSFISLSFTPLQANADALSDYYLRGSIAATPAQIQHWDSYTPRQKQLARKIEEIARAYYQKKGKPLPVNNRSIAIVMNALGANPQEASFIKDRMIATSNAQEIIPRVDALINRTQTLLGCLNNGGTGCIP
ncbi:MAG: hypothetical protein QNJ63_08510 [Calothrix sp. MO_192.B10]|nr:hypothetical protein [Calothrix sp. MO_192.B10]